MVTDYRYRYVKSVWGAGDLTSFSRIFEIIPKTVVSDDMGMHYHSFANKVSRPELLNVKQLMKLAELTGIPLASIVELVANDIKSK
jgi:hypothetical protein